MNTKIKVVSPADSEVNVLPAKPKGQDAKSATESKNGANTASEALQAMIREWVLTVYTKQV